MSLSRYINLLVYDHQDASVIHYVVSAMIQYYNVSLWAVVQW